MSKESKRRSSSIVKMPLEKAGIGRKKCHTRLSFDNTVTYSNFAKNDRGHQEEMNPGCFMNSDASDNFDFNVYQPEVRSTKNIAKQFDITSGTNAVDAILTDTLNAAPDHIETTAYVPLIKTSTSADLGFNMNSTVESGIEEATLNDNKIEVCIQHMSLCLDAAVSSTLACTGQEYDVLNPIKIEVRKGTCKADIQNIDYVSDQEDFNTFYGDITHSDNWSNGQEVESEDQKLARRKKVKKNKRTTKKTQDGDEIVGESVNVFKKSNVRKERALKKNSGLEYTTKKGVIVQAKTMLANPCFGKKCGNDCGSVPEERRQSLFEFFWKLDKVRRRNWLVSLTQKENIKRKRSDSNKRNITIKYFIKEGEGRRYVCQQFLAATLSITNKTIYSIVKNASGGWAKEDMRGRREPPNKTNENTIESVKRFIKGLPTVPSHYCSQDSSKVYLSEEFKNVCYLYKLYKNHYMDEGMEVVSETIFRKIFQENFNIGFHVPKKDKSLNYLQYEKNDIPKIRKNNKNMK